MDGWIEEEPKRAGIRMPPFRISRIYFAAKEDGGGGDSQSYMQSSSEIVTTNKSILTFLQTRCPSCRTTNSIRARHLSVYLSVSLSLFILTAIFPGTPGLTGYIGAKDGGSDGDNWSYETCLKLQSNHHHQHTYNQHTGSLSDLFSFISFFFLYAFLSVL